MGRFNTSPNSSNQLYKEKIKTKTQWLVTYQLEETKFVKRV